MKKMIIAWVFLTVILLGTLLYIGITFNKSVEDYEIIESDLKEAAEAYVNVKEINIIPSKEIKITDADLKNENLLPNMNLKDDECNGYVMVKMGITGPIYTPYIECNNYTTE